MISELVCSPEIKTNNLVGGAGEEMCNPAFFLAHQIRISEILPWEGKSYLTHAILHRTSKNVIM